MADGNATGSEDLGVFVLMRFFNAALTVFSNQLWCSSFLCFVCFLRYSPAEMTKGALDSWFTSPNLSSNVKAETHLQTRLSVWWWWWWRGGRDDQHMSSLSAQLESVRERELMWVRREGLPCWKFLCVTHVRSEGPPVILTSILRIPLRSAPKHTRKLARVFTRPALPATLTHTHARTHAPHTHTHAHTADGMQRGPVLSDGMCAHETSILNQPLQELRDPRASDTHTEGERERGRRGGRRHSREREKEEGNWQENPALGHVMTADLHGCQFLQFLF